MSGKDEDPGTRLGYMAVTGRPLAEEDDVVARAAAALWDAGLEPELAGLPRECYARRMAAAARALSGRDGGDLAAAGRAATKADCQGFLRQAWPWLRLAGTGPEDAGEDFHRARSGHGGFGVDAYGLCAASLRTIAAAFPGGPAGEDGRQP